MEYSIEDILKESYKTHDIPEYAQKTIEELRNESFENVSRVHDWRNYIPGVSLYNWRGKAVKQWQSLSDLQMVLLYAIVLCKPKKRSGIDVESNLFSRC